MRAAPVQGVASAAEQGDEADEAAVGGGARHGNRQAPRLPLSSSTDLVVRAPRSLSPVFCGRRGGDVIAVERQLGKQAARPAVWIFTVVSGAIARGRAPIRVVHAWAFTVTRAKVGLLSSPWGF